MLKRKFIVEEQTYVHPIETWGGVTEITLSGISVGMSLRIHVCLIVGKNEIVRKLISRKSQHARESTQSNVLTG